MIETQQIKIRNIFENFKLLKGNSKISVMMEPLWGIPYALYSFYLSLYMKSQGVTDKEIGYLIVISYIAGTFFSIFAGKITDRLGRKKTTFIFDFISWPLAIIIYYFSNNFWMFALATVINSVVRIVVVSWNLMIVEDSDNEQRAAAFNFISIINISTGVLVPLAGIMVHFCGIVKAERFFLLFAAISMSFRIIVRNYLYTETSVGQRILDERKKSTKTKCIKSGLPIETVKSLIKDKKVVMIACVFILFNVYIPIGTFNSLYFAPYMADVWMLNKSLISILGGVYSAVLFIVFVLINPLIYKTNKLLVMIIGILIQIIAIGLLISIPTGGIIAVILCMLLLASGFGIMKPLVDAMLAEVTEGNDRARIYSVVNTVTCIATALIGVISSNLYVLNPKIIYLVSLALLTVCIGILHFMYIKRNKCS